MKCSIPNKNVRQLLARHPGLEVTRTDHHVRVRHRMTRDFIIISMTPSDCRSLRRVERDLERLEAGVGYLQRAAPRRPKLRQGGKRTSFASTEVSQRVTR